MEASVGARRNGLKDGRWQRGRCVLEPRRFDYFSRGHDGRGGIPETTRHDSLCSERYARLWRRGKRAREMEKG